MKLIGTDVLKKVRTRGHWRVLIRPTPFVEKRIDDLDALLPTVEQARVRLRGWDFPHVQGLPHYSLGLNYVEEATDWQHHVETWRFHKSGQFVHYAGFSDEWRDQSGSWPADEKWKPGALLGIGAVIYRFTEVFEFAARLAQTSAAGEGMSVRIDTIGMQGRQIYVDSPNRWDMARQGTLGVNAVPFELTLSNTDLLAAPREHALKGCTQIFKLGYAGMSERVLRDWQAEVGKGFF